MRSRLEITDTHSVEELTDSGDIEGGVGVENDDVVNVRTDMGEAARDTVYEALECACGACRYHRHAGTLGEVPRSAECCEID